MPRGRISSPGDATAAAIDVSQHAIWHVTTRGVERRRVFLSRGDGLRFLRHLYRAVERFDLSMLALCLMPNHYHLVLEADRDALSAALHRVNGGYAQELNERLRRSGHLWGDRFATWVVRDDEHLRETCDYVVANPVRAGLCERASDWPLERKPLRPQPSAG